MPARIPVTVLTGFLGAGKTTLLNRILTEHHGQRIAVIENEFGELGIDQALVISADEEIFEMNNGCICCTVRGDLIRVLGNLVKRRDRFDRVIVETTGMANPGPVAQTFFVDEDVRADFVLDGVITLVDARHASLHLGEQEEAHEQVAFADVLVINKTDLATPPEVDALERRLRGINSTARVLRGTHGEVPLAQVLDVGGFDLERALATRPSFLEPEYPFEWAGAYALAAGAHELRLSPGPDPTLRVVIAPIADVTPDELARAAERAVRWMAEPPLAVAPGAAIPPTAWPCDVALGAAPQAHGVAITAPGAYAVFTQHAAEEVALELRGPDGQPVAPAHARAFGASHEHDDRVGSVALRFDRPFDEQRLNAWLGRVLRERGADIFRLKGILAIAGSPQRVVLQGVHMLVEARPDRPWGELTPRSEVVFIGKDLPREELAQGLAACLA